MHYLLVTSLLLVSSLAVLGETTFSQEFYIKKLVSLSTKQLASSNSASCSDLTTDVQNKCIINNGATCKEGQDYIDCAVGYVETDCGCDQVKDFCDGLLANIAGLPCTFTCKADNFCNPSTTTSSVTTTAATTTLATTTKSDTNSKSDCKSDNSCNSASSLIIYSSIGGILLYKMFIEKIVITF